MEARNAKADLPVKIYTPESRLRRPVALLSEMVTDLLSSRELAWQFFYRQITSRYRQSALGPFWALIPPVLVALTSTVLRRSGIIAVEDTGIPYPLYVMFGTVLWQLFANSLELPLKAMRSGIQLLRTIRLPVEGLLLASIAEMIFDLSIQFGVLVGVFALFRVPLSWGVFLGFGAMAMLMCLGIGIGLFLVPLGSLYTDVSSALPFITRFWFFLTPVIYTPPEKWPYSLLVDLNPVTPLLTTALDLSLEGTAGNLVGFWIMSAIAIVLLLVGWVFYRVAIPILVER
ncbi:MAG: ABC transporter permease [Elainellaceae cyanobacterium]